MAGERGLLVMVGNAFEKLYLSDNHVLIMTSH